MSAMTTREAAVMELRDKGLVVPVIARRLDMNEASVSRIVAIYGSDATLEFRNRQVSQERSSLELLRRIQAARGIA